MGSGQSSWYDDQAEKAAKIKREQRARLKAYVQSHLFHYMQEENIDKYLTQWELACDHLRELESESMTRDGFKWLDKAKEFFALPFTNMEYASKHPSREDEEGE
jgi:hypothetical protein